MDSGNLGLELFGALVAIMFVIFLAYLTTRFFSGTYKLKQQGKAVKVLEATSLGPKKQLVLSKVGDRYLLLGVTDQQITRLAEFTEEELQYQEVPVDQEGFLQTLQKVWHQKEKESKR